MSQSTHTSDFKKWPPTLAITYVIYCVVIYTIAFVGCGYAVFVLGASGWWFLLAIVIADAGYKPYRWYELYNGINSKPE